MPLGYNNYLSSLRIICKQVDGHEMSPHTLTEWIQFRFGTGEKQARKIESFLRRIEVLTLADDGLKVGKPASKWIESQDSGILLAFLHSRVQFFGEMLSEVSEQPRSSEELRLAAANYGFNWTTRTQVGRRRGWLQSAGMIMPLDGGTLTITDTGRDLLAKLTVHRPGFNPTGPAISEPLPTKERGGSDYKSPARQEATERRRVFEVDPDLIDRGTAAHMDVQDELAKAVRSAGLEPRSPEFEGPQFDIAWQIGDSAFVVEVKSMTKQNEDRQLRLGLGQVLSYAFLLDWPGTNDVQAVLAVEHPPTDTYWSELCEEHGVILTWPGIFEDLFD